MLKLKILYKHLKYRIIYGYPEENCGKILDLRRSEKAKAM